MENNQSESAETKFVPRGAIFFYVAMLLFFAIIWAGVYGLMLARR